VFLVITLMVLTTSLPLVHNQEELEEALSKTRGNGVMIVGHNAPSCHAACNDCSGLNGKMDDPIAFIATDSHSDVGIDVDLHQKSVPGPYKIVYIRNGNISHIETGQGTGQWPTENQIEHGVIKHIYGGTPLDR
jgi:hypothetical protein